MMVRYFGYTTFMKLSHLRGRKQSERLLRHGNVWKGKTMAIRWLPGAPKTVAEEPTSGVYVGSYASTKLHKSAVKRNRMRRRCREGLREAVKARETLPVLQLLLTPRSASLECDYADIRADAQAFLSHVANG